MTNMPRAILVRTSSITVVVSPFPDEASADKWIAKKRENPNGYLGESVGSNFSFEVLPLQDPDAFEQKSEKQNEPPFHP